MSFRNSFAAARAFALVSFLALSGFLASSGPASALTAAATVRDANSIQLGDVTYRLDGVDAPELDQVCIDDHADPWTWRHRGPRPAGEADQQTQRAL